MCDWARMDHIHPSSVKDLGLKRQHREKRASRKPSGFQITTQGCPKSSKYGLLLLQERHNKGELFGSKMGKFQQCVKALVCEPWWIRRCPQKLSVIDRQVLPTTAQTYRELIWKNVSEEGYDFLACSKLGNWHSLGHLFFFIIFYFIGNSTDFIQKLNRMMSGL